MKKKLLAMILGVAVMAGCLTGCAQGESGKASEGVVEGSSTEEASSAGGEAMANAGGELDTLDIFINFSWYPIDSFTGIIPDAIKEETGVDLNVTIATDSNQLGVMIGSGELPDLIFTDTEIDRLSNANLCYSYTELEEQFGASFAETDDERKGIARSLSTDGEYYTILSNYNTNEEWADLQLGTPGQPCVFYRKDILEEMGNPEINTVDDLLKVLEQCKEQYPDMVPYGLGGYWKFQALKNAMGVAVSQYDPETGDYYYEASAPLYKDALKVANLLARKGYVTAEAYANENEADAHQAAYNNGCIFYVWHSNYSNFVQLDTETRKLNPEAEWAYLPKLGNYSTVGTSKGWAGAFVSKSCSNPEAAARLLTYLDSIKGRRTAMWGREGVDYTLAENDVPEFSEEFKTSRADGSFDEKYNSLFYFGSSAIEEIYKNNSGIEQEVLDALSTYGEGYCNYPEVGVAMPVSSTDEGVIYNKMEELRKSYEAKIIFTTSDEEFESAYQEFMGALEQTGLSTYNEYMRTAIQDAKASLGLK